MSKNYIELEIGGIKADIDANGPVPSVTYGLEDDNDFGTKQSAAALDIQLPGTITNDKIHNTFYDPSIDDKTADQRYDNFQDARYIAGGDEILVGQYLKEGATRKNGKVSAYKGKIIGLNGDWVLKLQNNTILDFVNPRTHVFSLATVVQSWQYDGRDEVKDYVYAPVRYQKAFGDIPNESSGDPSDDGTPHDDNVLLNDLRPALSIYWILWRMFKSVGYKMKSTFFDTDYYRRSVLPWTWGGFDFIDDTRWAPLKFLATGGTWTTVEPGQGYPDPQEPDNSAPGHAPAPLPPPSTDPTQWPNTGAFENTPGGFRYYGNTSTVPKMLAWEYRVNPPSLNFGHIDADFSAQLNWNGKAGSLAALKATIEWYINGINIVNEQILSESRDVFGGAKQLDGFKEFFFEHTIDPGDIVGFRIHTDNPGGGTYLNINLEAFQLNFIKLTDNSIINFQNYPKMANSKALDLLRGEVDCFDLEIQTDPVKKEVTIEPMNSYVINGIKYPGYFNRNIIDWTAKVDISKEDDLELYSDYDREFDFTFKDDGNDGGLKIVQDRNQVTIGKARYLLPPRYNQDQANPKENRFYSPTMHYKHDIFKYITGISPQFIAIIPENVSNTSAPAAENTFNPKRAWYKGNIPGVGGWKFNGVTYTTLPFMFAVNYNPGGHLDPVFSYSDQQINGNIGQGLLNKFFIQRMAIYRNGRRYNPINVKLNNKDIGNFLHRESIVINGNEFFLMTIQEYNPLSNESTGCLMWLFTPIKQVDRDNSFPSITSLNAGDITNNTFDIKFWPHMLLTTDVSIPITS